MKESGISVADWRSLEAIRAWKENAAHRAAPARATDGYTSLRSAAPSTGS
jgi:heme-degrading monooxygenase HmoA